MRSKLFRLLIAFGTAIAAFVAGAIVITGVDLYLSGHGIRPLTGRPLSGALPIGVHLSVADAIVLILAFVVGAAAWVSSGKVGQKGRE